jgi:hypothetical protein
MTAAGIFRRVSSFLRFAGFLKTAGNERKTSGLSVRQHALACQKLAEGLLISPRVEITLSESPVGSPKILVGSPK